MARMEVFWGYDMNTLFGFAINNYYNKIRPALLFKEIHFIEERILTGQ
jgi:hypothetical protein